MSGKKRTDLIEENVQTRSCIDSIFIKERVRGFTCILFSMIS